MTEEELRNWLQATLAERRLAVDREAAAAGLCQWLPAELVERRPPVGKEEAALLVRWLLPEADRCAVEGREAVSRGRQLYAMFNGVFAAHFYEGEPPLGATWIRRALGKHFARAGPRTIEAVLERIRDRRVHLLEHVFDRRQQSLFVPLTVDENKLPGYFRRVVRFESLHVPVEDLPGQVISISALDALAALPHDPDEQSNRPKTLVPLLVEFWGKENGFSRAQRLEGLVSLGLGFATDVEEIARECSAFMESKQEQWDEKQEQILRRISQVLAKQEEAQRRRASAAPADRDEWNEELERIEARLERLRSRLARHTGRFLPRPKDVQKLLHKEVRNVGTVRHRRIGREIALFHCRDQQGRDDLEGQPVALSPQDSALVQSVGEHLRARPPSASSHGLPAATRQQLRTTYLEWLARGDDLLRCLRSRLVPLASITDPRPTEQILREWLADAEDLLELGVKLKEGVIGGLYRRIGWRLEHLLRIG